MNNKNIPLVIDLDGTLIHSDIMMEQIIQLLKKNPFYFPIIIFWLLSGFARLKKEVFVRTSINPELLPYNQELIEHIQTEKAKGRKIVLATASYFQNAIEIANYLGFFDEVLATTEDFNLRGENKAKVLVEKYGEKGFDYAGDSYIDLNVWKYAKNAILVNPSKDLIDRTKSICNIQKIYPQTQNKIANTLQAIRVNHWLKNLLLFIPLVMAHHFEARIIFQTFLGFFAFSLSSSIIYIMNDFYDLDNDRLHPIKRLRPFAAGHLHLQTGFYISIILFISAVAILLYLNNLYFTYAIIIYIIMNQLYSHKFKNIAVIDIILLTFFYIIRIYSGGFISDIQISEWLLLFSVFTFSGLAIMKRYAEVVLLNSSKINVHFIRPYQNTSRKILFFTGIFLSLLSSITFLFYTQSIKVAELYTNPKLLIVIVPILLSYYTYLWWKVSRSKQNDNPIEIVIKTPVTLLFIFSISIVLFFAL